MPSARIQALLRAGAEKALSAPTEWLDELDQASIPPDDMRALAEDPVLMAATRRINRGSLIHWAAANLEKPGAPVPPFVSDDILHNARELLRLGATDVIFSASRATHHTAWQLWMKIAFDLTQDPAELQALLDVSSRSIADFIDGTMHEIATFLRKEREALSRGKLIDQREWVTRLIAGAHVSGRQASLGLGYDLEWAHHAAIVWTERPGVAAQALDAALLHLQDAAGTSATLAVAANDATRWIWLHRHQTLDQARLTRLMQHHPDVRIAIASGDKGLNGFRQAHLDALAAQRLLGRFHCPIQITHFDQVRLVNLLSHDMASIPRFVSQTLGELAQADVHLRATLRAYINTGCNATEAATQLHLHRNTLLRRLSRAQEMLPAPLSGCVMQVGAALELMHWSADLSAPA